MILTKCYIENFGRHSQYSYDFTSGLNPIVEDNGWGKSTLAIFIKAMFYGLPVSRKSNFDENDRKKYTPWQGGNFGGYIEFKLGDREYRIERYFGKKESDDSFTLIDLHTNKKSTDYDENIGQTLFGIDAEAYERSTFIPQKAITGGANESLSVKLTNVIHGTEYSDNYERAIEIINSRKRDIKNNQNRGELPQVDAKIYEISQEIQTLKNSNQYIEQLNESLTRENNIVSQIEKESEQMKARIKNIADNKENIGKRQLLTDLQNAEKDINARIDEINQVLNGREVTRQAIDEVAELDRRLNVAKSNLENLAQNSFLDSKYNALNEYFKQGVPNDQIIEEMMKKNAEVKQTSAVLENRGGSEKKIKPLSYILPLVISLIALIVGVCVHSQMFMIAMACYIVAGGIAVVDLIVYLSAKKGGQYEETNEVTTTEVSPNEREIREFITKYEAINSSYDVHLYNIKMKVSEYRDLSVQMKEIISKIHKVKEEIADLDGGINKFFSGFGFRDSQISNAEKINILRQIIIEQESLIRQSNDNLAKIQTLKQSLNGNIDIKDEDVADLQAKEREILSRLDEHKETRIKIINQLNKYRDQMSALPELERELQECEMRKSELDHELKVLKLTTEYLDGAKDELSAKYLSPMKKSFDKYMGLIADEDKSYQLDTDLNVSVVEYGKSRELDYLSKGYQSVVDICVRFALVDTIFDREKPFIILDDPFVNLDSAKIVKVLDLLNHIARDYQIIYLTCHESRV